MGTFAAGAPCAADSMKSKPKPAHSSAGAREEATAATLAMSIIHDLRSPLAAIHSGAELLNSGQLPEHQVRRLARIVYDSSMRLQEMLQDYADLCLKSSQAHRSNLRSLVSHAVERIAAVAEAQRVVVTQEVPGDLYVTLDRRRIRSVLANLLGNALEAMPEGGGIRISATAREASVVIRVRDTGPGIAPEIRDTLFQPFVTARKASGWGLGLAQARQVVIDHGGEMWLESPPGGGACLAFSLPSGKGGLGGGSESRRADGAVR